MAKTEDNGNLAWYESMRVVPKEATKSFKGKGGFSGTDINPMWRIKRMTEIFGPCGMGWYYEVVNRNLETSSDGTTVCAFVSINLYVNTSNGWSKPIYGEGGNTFCEKRTMGIFTTDEAFKMALTDAFSNATKQLGLGADVWFEADKVHSTKYDQQTEAAAANAAAAKTAPTATKKPTAVSNPTPEAGEPKVTSNRNGIDPRKEVREFLRANPNAFQFYQSQYYQDVVNVDMFTPEHLMQMYVGTKEFSGLNKNASFQKFLADKYQK